MLLGSEFSPAQIIQLSRFVRRQLSEQDTLNGQFSPTA
jgi:hypothetical protein